MQPADPLPPRREGPPASVPTLEDDVALYYGFVEEVMRRGATEVAERFLAPDFVEHGAPASRHREELVRCLAARRTRFPDAIWTIELLAGIDGLVVCHTSVSCVASTGPVARGWETVVVRVAAGRIAESWRMRDEWLRAVEDDDVHPR